MAITGRCPGLRSGPRQEYVREGLRSRDAQIALSPSAGFCLIRAAHRRAACRVTDPVACGAGSGGECWRGSCERARAVAGLLRGAGECVGCPHRADLCGLVVQLRSDQGDIVWLGRAGAGLVLLAQPAIYGLIALFSIRTSRPVAWTLAAAALAVTAVLVRIVLTTTEPTPGRRIRELPSRLSFVLAGCLATTAGGLALAAGWTGGTFVLAAGALISLAIGLVIAWVLLVEVRRHDLKAAS